MPPTEAATIHALCEYRHEHPRIAQQLSDHERRIGSLEAGLDKKLDALHEKVNGIARQVSMILGGLGLLSVAVAVVAIVLRLK
jgi:hypothetical protein